MIQCKNISKIYKKGDIETRALIDATFSIQAGEFMAIMGPSGSGKSTLMHILGALDTQTSGDYFLEGQDMSELSNDQLADLRKNKIGFVFQAFNLLPRASALRNVMLPLIYSGLPRRLRKARAQKALSSVGLEKERYHHHTNQLSGGQIQRVAIARALVNDPAMILADEPTGNLDSKTGEVVLKTFQRLNQEENRTIILITHELYIAEHADRIIHLRDGHIVQDHARGKKILHKEYKE